MKIVDSKTCRSSQEIRLFDSTLNKMFSSLELSWPIDNRGSSQAKLVTSLCSLLYGLGSASMDDDYQFPSPQLGQICISLLHASYRLRFISARPEKSEAFNTQIDNAIPREGGPGKTFILPRGIGGRSCACSISIAIGKQLATPLRALALNLRKFQYTNCTLPPPLRYERIPVHGIGLCANARESKYRQQNSQ